MQKPRWLVKNPIMRSSFNLDDEVLKEEYPKHIRNENEKNEQIERRSSMYVIPKKKDD